MLEHMHVRIQTRMLVLSCTLVTRF